MYPSPVLAHRRADMIVHAIGLSAIVFAGSAMALKASRELPPLLIGAVLIYVLSALISNLASNAYHFAPWHNRRIILRRIDHSAIYLSITGTFTPLLVQSNTTRTWAVLILCWILSVIAIWSKITHPDVKSKWSTASYLALGAISLTALPDLGDVPPDTIWFILGGCACYTVGTVFYTRKTLPFRYSIWHAWVLLGGALMFVGIWRALF